MAHDRFFSLIVFAIFCSVCAAQPQWSEQSSGIGEWLSAAHFFNRATGVALTRDSMIVRTTNGGVSWIRVNIAPTRGLDAMCFVDSDTGVAVGGMGEIMRTTDRGMTWRDVESGTTVNLTGVSFFNINTGAAVGLLGAIARTTDGGVSWTTQREMLRDTATPTGLAILPAPRATGGMILRTTDGGTQWRKAQPRSWDSIVAHIELLNAVALADANTGAAVGYHGEILFTTDAGAHWNTQPSGLDDVLNDVAFVDAHTCVAVGANGTILRSSDDGATWKHLQSPTTSSLRRVRFFGARSGNIVGGDGTMLRSTDAGVTWTHEDIGTTLPLREILFAGTDSAMLVAENGAIIARSASVVARADRATIAYSLAERSAVSLQLRDDKQRILTTLDFGELNAGLHRAALTTHDAPAGTYSYRLQMGDALQMGSITIAQ